MVKIIISASFFVLSRFSNSAEIITDKDLENMNYTILNNVNSIAEEYKKIENIETSARYNKIYENEMSIVDSHLIYFYAKALFDASKKEGQARFYLGKIARRSSYICNRSVSVLEGEKDKYNQELSDLLSKQIVVSKKLCDEIYKVGDQY